jgi:hypothetical protein
MQKLSHIFGLVYYLQGRSAPRTFPERKNPDKIFWGFFRERPFPPPLAKPLEGRKAFPPSPGFSAW